MSALPMNLRGIVAHGDKRGRLLGFPTANINSEVPGLAYGVYASQIRVSGDNRVWPSVTSYGTRPTFAGSDQKIETHILDFRGDIYGRVVEVRLLGFIRPELRFSSMEELVATMQDDVKHVRALSRPTQ